MKFWYTAWIRNNRLPNDDQDFEWPLCFIIEGQAEISAREWGDLVARKYAYDEKEEFVSSTIVPADAELSPVEIAAERVFIAGSDVSTDDLTHASILTYEDNTVEGGRTNLGDTEHHDPRPKESGASPEH